MGIDYSLDMSLPRFKARGLSRVIEGVPKLNIFNFKGGMYFSQTKFQSQSGALDLFTPYWLALGKKLRRS